MNHDLSEILAEWPYDPTKVNVRLVQSSEGEPLIQIRLDLGILQLRYDGRPDGQTVNGYPSLLEYFEARADGTEPPPEDEQAEADASKGASKAGKRAERGGHGSGGAASTSHAERSGETAGGGVLDEEEDADEDGAEDEAGDAPEGGAAEPGGADEERLVLTPDDCRALRDEAAQYYHRYVALLILEDFEGVVRDTTRNLRVLDLCGRYAEAEEDRDTLEQFRAYIMMMRARALASQALRDNEPKAAVVAIDEGIEALRKYYTDQGEPEAFATSNEVQALQEMRDGLVPKLPTSPPSQAAELRQRLQHAIDQENYELAAILRDELRLVQERGSGEPRA
jgi:hypothetical protein